MANPKRNSWSSEVPEDLSEVALEIMPTAKFKTKATRNSRAKDTNTHKSAPDKKETVNAGRNTADRGLDLSAINLALGSNAEGTEPFSIDASHGGFPSFIFGPDPPEGSEQALKGGPFEAIASDIRAYNAERAARTNNRGQNQGHRGSAQASPNPQSRNTSAGEVVHGGFSNASFIPSRRSSQSNLAGSSTPRVEALDQHSSVTQAKQSASSSSDTGSASTVSGWNLPQQRPCDNSNNNLIEHVENLEIKAEPASFAESLSGESTPKATSFSDSAFPTLGHNSLSREDRSAELVASIRAARAAIKAKANNPRAKNIPTAFGGEAMQRSQSNNVPMAQQQSNGNGANGIGAPMNQIAAAIPASAGQQMDINILFQKVLELSDVLKENRERTQGIVASAEELASRAAATGATPEIKEADKEISTARIADLTRQNHDLQRANAILKREQLENTKLIGEYETALGQIVEMTRDLTFKKDMERHAASREFNQRLQEEKDAHLATRQEVSDWQTKAMRGVEMIRTAYRLREDEEVLPIRIVAGLQNEVRGLRNALGLEPEKFEDEFGYEILKNVQNGAGEP